MIENRGYLTWQSSRPARQRPASHTDHPRAPRHAPSVAYLLLMVLFGPGVRPTTRGLSTARVALALGIVALALGVAWLLGLVANAIIDPSPYS